MSGSEWEEVWGDNPCQVHFEDEIGCLGIARVCRLVVFVFFSGTCGLPNIPMDTVNPFLFFLCAASLCVCLVVLLCSVNSAYAGVCFP